MRFSKSYINQAFLSFMLVSSLGVQTGCSRYTGPKQSLNGSDATFVIKNASLVKVVATESDPSWNLPTVRAFQVKVCVADVAFLNPVIGETFKVRSLEGQKTESMTTDPNGCLNWEERVRFDFLAQETYIKRTRVITGPSPHRGSVEVPIALNPWQESDAAVVDLRFEHVSKLSSSLLVKETDPQSANANGAAKTESALVVNDIQYYFHPAQNEQNSTKIPLKLSFEPMAVRTQLDGSGQGVPLPIGKYHLVFRIFERKAGVTTDEGRNLLVEKELDAEAKKGKVTVSTLLELATIPAQTSTFELEYVLSPSQGPKGLGSDRGKIAFDSIYGIGEVSVDHGGSETTRATDSGSDRLPVRPEGDRPIFDSSPVSETQGGSKTHDSFASEPVLSQKPKVATEASAVPDCGDKDTAGGLVFDTVELNHAGFSGMTAKQETANEIQVTVKACVKSSIDWRPVTRFGFHVGVVGDKNSEVTLPRETDLSGCMRWNETIKFDYTEAERWIPLFVKMHSADAPYKDVTKALKVFVNPWQVGWLHAWDCRTGLPPAADQHVGLESGSKGIDTRAKVGIAEVALGFDGRDFELSPSLALTQKRKYRVQFRPLIIRRDFAHPTVISDTAADGAFRISIALLKNKEDAGTSDPLARFISGYEGEVRAKNGIVVKDVALDFAFSDIPWIAARNEFLIEISSLEPESGLQKSSWSSPVHIAVDDTVSTLVASDIDVSKLVQDGTEKRKQEQLEREKSTDRFQVSTTGQPQSANPQNVISSNFVGMNEFTSEELHALQVSPEVMISGQMSAKSLCPLYYGDQKIKPETLLSKVQSFLNLVPTEVEACRKEPEKFLHLTSGKYIDSIVKQPKEIQGDLMTLSVNAMFTRSGSISTYLGQSFGLALMTPTKVAALETEAYLGLRLDQSKTYSQNSMLIRSMMAEEIRLEFEAKARQCFVVGPRKNPVARKDVVDLPNKFLCAKQGTESLQTLQESWYFVSQISDHSSTLLRDPRRMNSRSWYRLLRGNASFDRLRAELEDKENHFVLMPFVIRKDIENSGKGLSSALKETFSPTKISEDGSFPRLLVGQ